MSVTNKNLWCGVGCTIFAPKFETDIILELILKTALFRFNLENGHNGEITSIVITDKLYRTSRDYKRSRKDKPFHYKWIFSSGKDGDIRQYNIFNCQCVNIINGDTPINEISIETVEDVPYIFAVKPEKDMISCISIEGKPIRDFVLTGLSCYTISSYFGTIFLASNFAMLQYYDILSGALINEFSLACPITAIYFNHLASKTKIFVAYEDLTSCYVNIDSGKVTSEKNLNHIVYCVEAIKRNLLLLGCENGYVLIVDTNTGEVKESSVTGLNNTVYRIHVEKDIVYCTSKEEQVTMLEYSPKTNSLNVKSLITFDNKISDVKVVDDEKLWKCNDKGKIECINIVDKTVQKSIQSSPLLFIDGIIIYLTYSLQLLCFSFIFMDNSFGKYCKFCISGIWDENTYFYDTIHFSYILNYIILVILFVIIYYDVFHFIDNNLTKKADNYIFFVSSFGYIPILYLLLCCYIPNTFTPKDNETLYMKYSNIEYGSSQHIAVFLCSSLLLILFLFIVTRIHRVDCHFQFLDVDFQSFSSWFNLRSIQFDHFLYQSDVFNKRHLVFNNELLLAQSLCVIIEILVDYQKAFILICTIMLLILTLEANRIGPFNHPVVNHTLSGVFMIITFSSLLTLYSLFSLQKVFFLPNVRVYNDYPFDLLAIFIFPLYNFGYRINIQFCIIYLFIPFFIKIDNTIIANAKKYSERKTSKSAIKPVKTKKKEKRKYNGSINIEDEAFSESAYINNYNNNQRSNSSLSDVLEAMTMSAMTYPSPRPTGTVITNTNYNNNTINNASRSSSETMYKGNNNNSCNQNNSNANKMIKESITSLQKKFSSDISNSINRKTPRPSIPMSLDNNNNNNNANYDPTLLIDTNFLVGNNQEFECTSTVPVSCTNMGCNNNNKHMIKNNGVLYSSSTRMDSQTTPLQKRNSHFNNNSFVKSQSVPYSPSQLSRTTARRIGSQPINCDNNNYNNNNNNTPLLSSTTAGTPDESPINLQIECSDQHHQQQQSLSPSTTKQCSTVQISLGNNSKSSGSGNDNFQNKNVKISIMCKEVEEKKDKII